MKNLIKVERARHRLTQGDLAEKVGVSRQTIYAIENNKFNPSVTLAIKMARYFKVTVEYLFRLADLLQMPKTGMLKLFVS